MPSVFEQDAHRWRNTIPNMEHLTRREALRIADLVERFPARRPEDRELFVAIDGLSPEARTELAALIWHGEGVCLPLALAHGRHLSASLVMDLARTRGAYLLNGIARMDETAEKPSHAARAVEAV